MRLKDLKIIEQALSCYASVCREDIPNWKSQSIRDNLTTHAKNLEEVNVRVRTTIEKHEAKLRSKQK